MLYLSQVIIYTALLCIIYILFLRNRPMHSFNRAYLLIAAVLPVILPFLQLPAAIMNNMQQRSVLNIQLPEFVVTAGGKTTSLQFPDMVLIGYATISLLLCVRMLWQYYKIRTTIKRHEQFASEDHILVRNTGYGPGSFGKYIFLPEADADNAIIAHELAHIRLHHTRDIIFLNLLQVFFWPNLLLIWLKKELVQVHEFQADDAVEMHELDYANLLLSGLFGNCTLPATHSFFIHPIKRRIMMLKRKSNKAQRIALASITILSVAALAGNLIFIQSSQAKVWDIRSTTELTDNAGGNDDGVVRDPEKKPQFPGDMFQFMAGNLEYPKEAMQKGIEGKVYIEFVVDEEGSITKTNVLESPDPLLTNAAIQMLNKMPKWIPGEVDGKKVPALFMLPISFKLPKEGEAAPFDKVEDKKTAVPPSGKAWPWYLQRALGQQEGC